VNISGILGLQSAMASLFTRSVRLTLDVVALSIAYWVAWCLRFEFGIPDAAIHVALMTWPCVLVAHLAAMTVYGIPRMAWRYVSMRDVLRVLIAVGTSSSLLVILRLVRVLPATNNLIPLSVLAMDCVLGFVGLVGLRALWRVRSETHARRKRSPRKNSDRVLLIGAGEAGVMVAREIANRPDLGLMPVGFLDDDQRKAGTIIAGLPVLGTTTQIDLLARRFNVSRTLITIANASGSEIRRISEICRDAGLQTKIIPGLYEIVGDKMNLSRVRQVAIEDLLRRDPVHLHEDVISNSLRSRVVLVTGAGGSIGSELCRQICRFGPEGLVLVERYENALFEIHRELATMFPHVRIEPRIGDICDLQRMTHIFAQTKPEIVFHAAAHKHVPMMEWNPGEAVKNNVAGTQIVATLSDHHGAERFVLVSTDKAVNPTSVMGATKRVAEIYLQALSQRSQTRFVTVRFGNVLGSAGSVVPIFKQQIASGGPVLVTHPEMRRYFMTIPEASQLVLQAGAMGKGGEIFILDMGDPVKIVDLARDLITLSGLRPNEDIEIRFTGIRPGEKLFEELSTDTEQVEKTVHPKICIGRIVPHEWDVVVRGVENLVSAALSNEPERVRAALGELVPEYAVAHPANKRNTAPQGERALSDVSQDLSVVNVLSNDLTRN